MVSQCMENKRTVRLTWRYKYTREGTELWEYMWGRVLSESAERKHNSTYFVRGFRGLTDIGGENHRYLICGTWLLSKNDNFTFMVIVTYELPCTHIKDTNSHRQNLCFWFLVVHYDKPCSRTLNRQEQNGGCVDHTFDIQLLVQKDSWRDVLLWTTDKTRTVRNTYMWVSVQWKTTR